MKLLKITKNHKDRKVGIIVSDGMYLWIKLDLVLGNTCDFLYDGYYQYVTIQRDIHKKTIKRPYNPINSTDYVFNQPKRTKKETQKS